MPSAVSHHKNDPVTETAESSGAQTRRVFLLSPANIAGRRAAMLLNDEAGFELAVRFRSKGAPLGEIFAFISGLYFRGKLAYAQRFNVPPPGASGVFVITACGGLIPPETLMTRKRLREICNAQINCSDLRYRQALDRDARSLAKLSDHGCQIILLGSVATPKYTEPLLEVFGEHLFFPAEFAGRGDMSRGGLMLRCVESGVPLTYVSLHNAARHGPKPPKLIPRGTTSALVSRSS